MLALGNLKLHCGYSAHVTSDDNDLWIAQLAERWTVIVKYV